MSYGTRARHDFVAHSHRSPSRNISPYAMCSGVAVVGAVLACALTVYANVFGASVYPAAAGGDFDVAVIKRSPAPAVQNTTPAFNEVFAALSEPAPLISAPPPK